ncbi:MAG: hypothetical protein RL748_2924, partial [Pseudomonadota bacterium]
MHSLESLFAQIVLFLKVLSVIVVPFLIHIYLIKWKGLAIRYKYTYTSRLFS